MNEFLKNLTVLIVEDEEATRKLLSEILSTECGKVIGAQNGDEGIKKFKKFNPDIVITDVAMPIVGGLDMAQEIKKISKDTPVVVLSAYSQKEQLLRAIEVGIDKYVLKPLDVEEFLRALEQVAYDKVQTTSVVEVSGGYVFHKTKRILVRDGEEIALTKKELAFISLLIKRLGSIVLHEEIKSIVWSQQNVTEAAIRTFVKRVRDKVGVGLIKNVPGLGYKIEI